MSDQPAAVTPRKPAPRRVRAWQVALVVLLILCLCCGGVWLLTRGPVIRLMCLVSDTACASFCRAAPAECELLRLPPSRGPD